MSDNAMAILKTIPLALENNWLADVMAFSMKKHDGQLYGDKPYFSGHIIPVFDEVRKYTDNDVILAVALLHDVLEDTDTTYEELEEEFGVLASQVYCLTDSKEGKNRKERKLLTYYKTREYKSTRLVKLCDRVVNVREGGKIDMYRKEHYAFKCALWTPEDEKFQPLWDELDTRLEGYLL